MIARGFKPVAWVAAIGTAALGCYMLSLQVAAERADLAALERRIVSTQQDIRALQTELGTRGRLSQLEHWNAEVLALSAPVAGQFLESNLSLARFDVRQRGFDPGAVRMAAADPAPAAPAPAAPVQMASAPARAPAPAEPAAPLIRRAAVQTLAAPAPAPSAPTPTPAAPTAIPARASALLDSGTLSELRAESRSERAADGGN